MPATVISAHEARLAASRTRDADHTYSAVSAVLQHASSRIAATSERGEDRTMFTVMPDFHGFNAAHAAEAAREVARALRRRGYKVTALSATDLLISWAVEERRAPREGEGRGGRVAAEDAWRFAGRHPD